MYSNVQYPTLYGYWFSWGSNFQGFCKFLIHQNYYILLYIYTVIKLCATKIIQTHEIALDSQKPQEFNPSKIVTLKFCMTVCINQYFQAIWYIYAVFTLVVKYWSIKHWSIDHFTPYICILEDHSNTIVQCNYIAIQNYIVILTSFPGSPYWPGL